MMKDVMRHNKWSCKLKVPWRLQAFTLHYGNRCHRLQGLRSPAVQFFLPVSRLRNQVITARPKMFGTGIDSFFPSLRMSHLHESCICWMTNAKWEVAEFPRKMWQIPSQLENSSSVFLGGFEWFKSIGSREQKKTPVPPVTWRYRDLECVECNTLSWVVLVTDNCDVLMSVYVTIYRDWDRQSSRDRSFTFALSKMVVTMQQCSSCLLSSGEVLTALRISRWPCQLVVKLDHIQLL